MQFLWNLEILSQGLTHLQFQDYTWNMHFTGAQKFFSKAMDSKFYKYIFFLLCTQAFFKGYTDDQSYIQISPEFDAFSQSLNKKITK